MNTGASRLVRCPQRHLLRRSCWTTNNNSNAIITNTATTLPTASTATRFFHRYTSTATPTEKISHPWSLQQLSLSGATRVSKLQLATTTTITPTYFARSFATTTSSGGDGKEAHPPIPSIIDTDEEVYDPFEITKSFEDTSYYYPPADEFDPKVLASRYEGMTNEELLDGSTIAPRAESHTGSVVHTWDSLIHSPPIRDKNKTLPKGTLVGTVVSTKMQKTVNVAVDRYKVHKKYKKRVRYTRKFMAHDEAEVARDGDLVMIVPSQKISKNKHFVLREILRAKGQL